MLEKLMPRHMQIIYDINWRFMDLVRKKYGEDNARLGECVGGCYVWGVGVGVGEGRGRGGWWDATLAC